MATPVIHPTEQRDRSLQRLRDLTFAIAAGATGLVGVFSIVAATTLPGHSDSGATASSGSTPSTTTNADEGDTSSNGPVQVQPPSNGSFGPGAGTPHAVSGGSR